MTEMNRRVQTCESSLSSSTARCTMGPRTAYSTFFTVGFIVSMVNTLARDVTPFSVIFSLGSPRRVALRLDKALPGEEDRGGEVSERTLGRAPGCCAPLQPPNNSPRPRLKSRTFLTDSSCIRVADIYAALFRTINRIFWSLRVALRPATHRLLHSEGVKLKLCK